MNFRKDLRYSSLLVATDHKAKLEILSTFSY